MGARAGRVRVAVAPRAPAWLVDAATAAGAEVVAPPQASALVWTEPAAPRALAELLAGAPGIAWVQLPWAGVEAYADAGVVDGERRWTSAKGVYARPVAEHALALALAGLRGLKEHATRPGWGPQAGESLYGATVTVFGRGGIAVELAKLLEPFGCELTCVARTSEPVAWARRTVSLGDRLSVLHEANVVVLALSLSPATAGVIGAAELARMRPGAWLVNVARGAHVVTDALVEALRQGRIGGAALDVTDPEPLPHDHPLWLLPNCLITPHTAVTQVMSNPLLAARVTDNLRRFGAGQPLLGRVDPELGY